MALLSTGENNFDLLGVIVSSNVQPSTLLVVDDDKLLTDILAIWLEDEGFSVRRAYDGPQGLAAVNRVSPDLVLADIGLPGLNGVLLAARVREHGVPVVLLSANGAPPDMPPDTPFLAKPFDLEDIYQLIVKTLAKKKVSAAVSNGH